MIDYKALAATGNLVPNQRLMSIHKTITNKENPYACINLEALEEAVYNLSNKGVALKLYVYLAKNQNEHSFCFSSSHFMSYANCSLNAFNHAFEELESKGYLVKVKTLNNNNAVYKFYDKSVIETEYHLNRYTVIYDEIEE